MLIALNERACARIVVAPDAPEVERHAAAELQAFIERISGARLPVAETPDPDGGNVLIGAAAERNGFGPAAFGSPDLGADGYVAAVRDGNAALVGVLPRSSLYAVYHLLERHLGCGFFEDGDRVPRAGRIELGNLLDICKPRFDLRIYSLVMQYAYNGMIWWDWEQLKQWCDWMAKKRLNMWEPVRVLDSVGLVAAAAAKLGVAIGHTAWQRERIALMRRVIAYARMLGIRSMYCLNQYNQGMEGNQNEPGAYPFPDRMQLEQFVSRYREQTGEEVPLHTYMWCGTPLPVMDARHPLTQRFVTALVESYVELFGTDHCYLLSMPSEGQWQSDDLDDMQNVTYAMLLDLIGAVRRGDPDALIFSRPPFEYAKTYEAQKRAIRDAGATIVADWWLNVPGRMHGFMMNDYYFGLPWSTGMISHCGTHTNPWGDLPTAVRNARELAADPQADRCIGFTLGSEIHHRNILMIDLFTELAWNPADADIDRYIERYALRRYGASDGGGQADPRLSTAVRTVAETLLSHYNMDNTNGPLYRRWRGGYLPGATPDSVRRTLAGLPALRTALEALLVCHEDRRDCPLYRFDLVDLGRTYLGGLFNEYLARTRVAFRSGDHAGFAKYSDATLAVMRFMARYCSADPQFRLSVYDDWAGRWPPILPGFDNSETNWITFTALISSSHWKILLDYMAEDFAELIAFYYFPRVQSYIGKMRERLDEGKDISGRLVYRGTDTPLPNRISDWTPPKGLLAWSAYGAPCEPELTAEDDELARSIILAGTVSGKFACYEGEMLPLVRELLDAYPVPDGIGRAEDGMPAARSGDGRDEKTAPMGAMKAAGAMKAVSAAEALKATEAMKAADALAEISQGSLIRGFEPPAPVEQVIVPKELQYLVTVEQLSSEYNIVRGDIASYRVIVSDYLELHRLADERSIAGVRNVAAFAFKVLGRSYVLKYDPGSDYTVSGLVVEQVGDTAEQ